MLNICCYFNFSISATDSLNWSDHPKGVRLFWYRDVFFVVSRWPMSPFWYRDLLFGIEISFLVSRFCILLIQPLDHLLPWICLCLFVGPRHPVHWRSKQISIPKRRSKNLDTKKKTSRYQLKESPTRKADSEHFDPIIDR